LGPGLQVALDVKAAHTEIQSVGTARDLECGDGQAVPSSLFSPVPLLLT
jgi:hypothetical protein